VFTVHSQYSLNDYTYSLFYVFFWVILRSLNFICQRFGTLCLLHLHRPIGMPIRLRRWNRVFRNFGIQNSDAGKLPRRNYTTFRTRRNFEIKNRYSLFIRKSYMKSWIRL